MYVRILYLPFPEVRSSCGCRCGCGCRESSLDSSLDSPGHSTPFACLPACLSCLAVLAVVIVHAAQHDTVCFRCTQTHRHTDTPPVALSLVTLFASKLYFCASSALHRRLGPPHMWILSTLAWPCLELGPTASSAPYRRPYTLVYPFLRSVLVYMHGSMCMVVLSCKEWTMTWPWPWPTACSRVAAWRN